MATLFAAIGTTIAGLTTAGTAAAGTTAATAATTAAATTAAATTATATTAAATTATAAGAAAAAGSGISLTSILSGVASVLGVVAAVGAGREEGERFDLAAVDAEREQALETLQGVERRSSIRRSLVEAIGAQDTAFAASGVDLSFGTARQARTDAFREADLGLTTSAGTEEIRRSRLQERAANFRIAGKRARRAGKLNAAIGGIRGVANALG